MYLRVTFAALLLLLPLQAAASEIADNQDKMLASAAVQMKLKNYSTALKLAAVLPRDGRRDLLMGVAALQSGRHDEAAELLGKAVRSYPFLADYALYYQAESGRKAGRSAEAVLLLKALQKGYPDSPLARKSLLLEGEILFESGEYAPAEVVYQKFVEKYVAGSDALQASYRTALCREKKGDGAAAALMLRSIWLNSPGSTQAAKAEEGLKRLAAAGISLQPYTSQELLKRAAALYELRRFEPALTTLRSINAKGEKQDFTDRLALKIGQALLKSRRYNEAEDCLKELSSVAARVEVRSEAFYLMARAIEKSGRDEEAFAAYNLVAVVFPGSVEADAALLDAAFIRKFQNRPKEAAELFCKILEMYPKTKLANRILWESGWAHYLAGNRTAASEQFKKLFTVEEYRERALFWYGRSIAAAGDLPAAADSYASLRKEFPFGFYALMLQKSGAEQTDVGLPNLSGAPAEALPLPEGYERVKALIELGFIADASAELAAGRKKLGKGKGDAGLARLYLEIGNYSGAMSLFNSVPLKRSVENSRAWAFLYPQAFGPMVMKYAEKAGVEPSLAYAVMRAESSFAPLATSPVGARGLMQLMPKTAAMVLHEKSIEPERLYDAELNIRLGTRHLRELVDQYGGNLTAVIASYNAGAKNVNRWLKTYATLNNEEFIESIPFGETRDYVKKVLTAATLYKRLYGMK